MATPKFNRAAKEFMQKIYDPITESAGTITAGSVITTVLDIENYINKAMMNLFNNIWTEVEGSILRFLQILPESQTLQTITLTLGIGESSIEVNSVNNLGNLVQILPSRTISSNAYLPILPPHRFIEWKTSQDPFLAFANNPHLCYVGGKIYYLATTLATIQIQLNYIRSPLLPDGNQYVSGPANTDIFLQIIGLEE
jgi:hypothetical protein